MDNSNSQNPPNIQNQMIDIQPGENDHLDKNKEKFFFFKFLMYNSKMEMHYEFFTNILYWTSIMEIVVWFISFIIFCTDTSEFGIIWALILHVPRGVIGFLILKYIPSSFQVIENLEDTQNDSLDVVQEKLLTNFVELLKENEPKMKPFLITYLALTGANLLIDIIIFFYLIVTWGEVGYQHLNVVALALLVIFLSTYNLLKLISV